MGTLTKIIILQKEIGVVEDTYGTKGEAGCPGTLHHVMIRGIEGSLIFLDDQDRRDFVLRMGQRVDRTGTRILAWVFLDNHVHLLVFSGFQGIPKFMRCVFTRNAQSPGLPEEREGLRYKSNFR